MVEVYMDNAATSWPKPAAVVSSVCDYITDCGGSERGTHRRSQNTNWLLNEARELVAELIGASSPFNLVFTAGSTPALNIVIKGFLRGGDHVVITNMRHNSVGRPIRSMEQSRGIEVTSVACSSDGHLEPDAITSAIKVNTRLVVIDHASNVTGTLIDLAAVAAIARAKGTHILVDASQTVGIHPIDVGSLGIDFLAMGGHKGLFGPAGIGCLFIRSGLESEIAPLVEGGTGSHSEQESHPEFMPDKFESGTRNMLGIVGMSAGVGFVLETGVQRIQKHIMTLTECFLELLKAVGKVVVYGPCDASRQTGIISLNIDGWSCTDVGFVLDESYDIRVRAGLHCAPVAHRTIGSIDRGGTVRFSLGYFNTLEEVHYAVDCLREISAGQFHYL